MASITFAQPLAMATTQLARTVHFENVCTLQHVETVERNSLRMSWVVVTDSNGSAQLRMQWATATDR
jgi:hypothetical protein